MIKTVEGKTILITGASSGIGEAFAYELAARGSHLILTARSDDKLEEIAWDIRQKHPDIRVGVYPFDLAAAEAPAALAEALEKDGHSVDILVNNAGFGKWSQLLDEELATYDAMLQLNMGALVKLTYLLLPGMLGKGGGGVINIASTAAFQPCPYFAVYGASKAFVLSFSGALFGELHGKGITVTAVCPGYTNTPFWDEAHVKTRGFSFVKPARVVREGLAAFMKGRNYCITGGWGNYILAQATRFFPRRIAISVVGNMFKRRLPESFSHF